ncbi:helix-turn-helix transcriptional regulator [Anaerotruncus rubiinfantis]|uniref:helix-turn-helix transcriptional regulator n=1 Tax=Anaerotruncus rubiinfantis TaxID=1720200 RepID=UPI0034A581A1
MIKDVRDCIKPAIEKCGMKQNIVAERSGLSSQQLCDVISKRRKLEANELINLCHTLRITPNDLLQLEECPDKAG